MKRVCFIFAMASAALLMGACAKENAIDTTDDTAAVVEDIATRTKGAMGMNQAPAQQPKIEQITYKWENDVDIFEFFPESVTPDGQFDNFLFVSNGEPFKLIMLYSNGGYRHITGIYWYDNAGNCHEQEFWNEFEEQAKSPKTWYNPNGSKNPTGISRLSDDAGAYEIQLPAGTKFGFFVHSLTADGAEIKEAIREPLPFGPLVDHIYKFYTEQEKNWSYNVAVHDNYALRSQSMTTSVGDFSIIGFEDISLTYPSCDKDYNDCVFALNPAQQIDGAPQTEKVEGSVETNLSVADKGSYDQVKLSIHIRANTDVAVVLPIADKALSDDYVICAKHDIEASYSEPININGETVELKYSIVENGYLKVETKGITQEILDYCNNTYIDGMTFECYLGYGKFVMQDTPTITFTKEPYMYVTSCVNNSPEAKDYEVVWEADTNLLFCDPAFGPADGLNYTHNFYSCFTLEELQSIGFFKNN